MSVGLPLVVFVAVFANLMRPFSNRSDDHTNNMNNRFDDLKDRFESLAGDVKTNGEAITKLSEKVGVLSEDVVVIKDISTEIEEGSEVAASSPRCFFKQARLTWPTLRCMLQQSPSTVTTSTRDDAKPPPDRIQA